MLSSHRSKDRHAVTILQYTPDDMEPLVDAQGVKLTGVANVGHAAALIVEQGGKINAAGTITNPIVPSRRKRPGLNVNHQHY